MSDSSNIIEKIVNETTGISENIEYTLTNELDRCQICGDDGQSHNNGSCVMKKCKCNSKFQV